MPFLPAVGITYLAHWIALCEPSVRLWLGHVVSRDSRDRSGGVGRNSEVFS